MKKLLLSFLVIFCLFGFLAVSTTSASLTTIGTATLYDKECNLIYEGELGNEGLVWLDFTKGHDVWDQQIEWVSELGSPFIPLSVALDSNYTTSIDWTTGWRLPSAGENPQSGYDQTTSEMGHLFYVSLEKGPGGVYDNMSDQDPFENLKASPGYWTGTEYSTTDAWYFYFAYGHQGTYIKDESFGALPVHPGTVSSAVPIPPAILLLGSGIMGLGLFRRKFKK